MKESISLLIHRLLSHLPGIIRTTIEGASPTRRTSVSKGGREEGREEGRETGREGGREEGGGGGGEGKT